jgi:hypothetical protein
MSTQRPVPPSSAHARSTPTNCTQQIVHHSDGRGNLRVCGHLCLELRLAGLDPTYPLEEGTCAFNGRTRPRQS